MTSIAYTLHANKLTQGSDAYTAIVSRAGTVDQEGIIKRMIERGSTITKTDCLAVLEEYSGAIESLLQEGYRVLTPGVNYRISIKGVFSGPDDSFDPARHTINIVLNKGVRFRKTVPANIRLKKEAAIQPRPYLGAYVDFGSKTNNGPLTPGSIGKISGHLLKFDPADPNQGIFFIGDNSTTRVDMVVQNKPIELIFSIPTTLTPGDYMLEVRALFGKSTIRNGRLTKTLVVS